MQVTSGPQIHTMSFVTGAKLVACHQGIKKPRQTLTKAK